MMRHPLLSIMTMLMSLVATAQTNRVFIEDFEIAPGETDSVPVLLSNVDPTRGLQFNISLPEGLNYMRAEVSEYASGYKMSVMCNYNKQNSCYSAFIYPPGPICFPADTAAVVMYIWLTAKDDFKGGPIITWKCRGSTIDNNTIIMDGDTTAVTVPRASLIGIPVENPQVQDQYFNLTGQSAN